MRASRPGSALALLLVLAGAPGCREGGGADDAGVTTEPAPEPRRPSGDDPVRIVYPAAPGSFVDLVDELGESVVNLRTTRKVSGGPSSVYPTAEDDFTLGSGVLIDSAGLVLTNDHVIASAGELRVVLHDGTEVGARVLGRDPRLDVALLEIDAAPRYRAAPLGSSDQLNVGEWVLALGNPFAGEVTASACIVSALGRASAAGLSGTGPGYRTFLHTDCAIDASNSGGPLVNTAGEVVGINSAGEKRAGRTGFAVPIDRVKDILPMLKDEGRVVRAWLGVFIHPVTDEIARQHNLETITGALVSDVVPGSPAARAGVKPGDVILKYDDKDVDHRNLPWLSQTSGIGRRLPVVVWRNKGTRTLTLHTEAMPE